MQFLQFFRWTRWGRIRQNLHQAYPQATGEEGESDRLLYALLLCGRQPFHGLCHLCGLYVDRQGPYWRGKLFSPDRICYGLYLTCYLLFTLPAIGGWNQSEHRVAANASHHQVFRERMLSLRSLAQYTRNCVTKQKFDGCFEFGELSRLVVHLSLHMGSFERA